jgi:predicted aspartyl protease
MRFPMGEEMRLTRLTLLTAFLVFSAGVALAAPSCQLGLDADLPVTYADGHIPVVTVDIRGQAVRLMVDSGAAISFLSPGAYNRLQLDQTVNPVGYTATGLGGGRQISAFALVDIHFGVVEVKDQVLAIFSKSTPDEIGPNAIDGIMGYDILQYFDIGLDLPHNRISLYTPQHCTITETPWPGDYAPTPFTRPDAGSPVIQEAIDGQNFNVTIDTGANSSLIMQAPLRRSNVTPEAEPATSINSGTGMAGLKFQGRRVQFSTLDIGAEEFDNAWLTLDTTREADLNELSDGLLGEDYLSSHRIFIDNWANTAYLGLSGG